MPSTTGKTTNASATFTDLARPTSRAAPFSPPLALIVFGDSYGPAFTVDTELAVPATAYQTLSDVAPASFWSPYTTGT